MEIKRMLQRPQNISGYQPESGHRIDTRMAREEGIIAGMSSGGALYAALQIASELESGVIVCITCDRGDRYLSSDLFE